MTHLMRTIVNVTLDFWLPYYILSRGLKDGETMRAAMRWFACGGMALAGLLLFEVWRQWPMFNELYSQYGVPTLFYVKTRGAFVRAGGPFMEPTSIALVMALCLTALWLLRDNFRSSTRYGLLCAATFLGSSAPQSRNGWVALGIAIVCADVFGGRWRALAGKLVLAGTAISLILAAASASPDFSASLGLSGDATGTADYRRDLLARGTEEFWKNPVVGVSALALEQGLEDMRQGEGIIDYVNSYLWFALIAGSVGIAGFSWNLFAPLGSLWRLRRRVFEVDAVEPSAFVFGTIATLSTALFFTSFSMRPAVLTVGFFGFAAAIRAACKGLAPGEVDPDTYEVEPAWRAPLFTERQPLPLSHPDCRAAARSTREAKA